MLLRFHLLKAVLPAFQIIQKFVLSINMRLKFRFLNYSYVPIENRVDGISRPSLLFFLHEEVHQELDPLVVLTVQPVLLAHEQSCIILSVAQRNNAWKEE